MGTVIGIFKTKVGGVINLASLVISGIIAFSISVYPYKGELLGFLLAPLPYPHSALVIIGGILCLISSDN